MLMHLSQLCIMWAIITDITSLLRVCQPDQKKNVFQVLFSKENFVKKRKNEARLSEVAHNIYDIWTSHNYNFITYYNYL